MRKLKDDLLPFLTQEEIKKLVKSLARQIEGDYEGQEVILVCPLMGSIHFVADLCRELRLPQKIDFVLLRSLTKRGTIQILKDLTTDITGKHVLVVEEIIDSGRRVSFLQSHLLANNPASLKIVTLLDKPARRETAVQADYIGRVIDDRYVVGYGMDSESQGRHFPDIYTLKN